MGLCIHSQKWHFFQQQWRRRGRHRNRSAVHEPCVVHSLNSTAHHKLRDGLPIVMEKKERYLSLQRALQWLLPDKEKLNVNGRSRTSSVAPLKVILCGMDETKQTLIAPCIIIIFFIYSDRKPGGRWNLSINVKVRSVQKEKFHKS